MKPTQSASGKWFTGLASRWVFRCTIFLLVPLHFAFGSVPQASVLPEPIRLPLVDGESMRFTRLSTENGLSQTRVSQIVQDDQGFIWFGTQYGLNRYDGYSFKVFVHDPRRGNSLGGVFISSLFKDHSGALWVGCSQSLDRFDPVTENFTHYRLGSEDSEGLSGIVVHISEDQEGTLWLATGAGLHRLNPVSGQVVRYRHDPSDPASLSSNDVKTSGEDKLGNFWVGTSEGLDRFDRKTGKVTLHVPLKEPVQLSFLEDHLGNFWIFHASGDGLALLDRQTDQLTHYSFYENSPSVSELTGVMGMVEDRAGNLWLGSPGIGLLRFDREKKQFVHYKNNPSDLESLAEDKVIALFEDREGNIWTGLHSMGPNHFNPKPPLFEKFRPDPGNPNSLEMNFVNAIVEDRRDFLWIGNDKGLTRIDRKTGQYTRFNGDLGLKPMVITITEDRQGNIWVGTYGHGIARLDQATGRFKTFTHRPDDPTTLGDDRVHRLFVDHQGTLWAATDNGLSRFDEAKEQFTTYLVDRNNRRAQDYVAMTEDQEGKLWLGSHYSGLHRFDPATGEFKIYKADPAIPGSLSDDMVPTVLIDHARTIWVGTQNGLDKLDPKTGRFTAYYQSENRPVSCLLEDSRGNLWMSSNKGLAMLDPKTERFKNYSVVDGLPGNDLTGWGAGSASPSGELFFGGFAGGLAFHPEKLVDSTYVPPIALTALRFPYASTKSDQEEPAKKYATDIRSLTLRHSQNSFSLEFSALSYFNPPANRYRYKLEGLDEGWNEVGSDQRIAAYTTLPAGRYTFRVQGATSRGNWSEPGVVLPINVLPAWWQTWWFQGGMGLAALGILFAGYRARVGQIKDREREFRKLAENAPDMVVRFDSELRFRYVNPLVEKFTGLGKEELIGKTDTDLHLLGKEVPVRKASLQQAINTGQAVTEEFAYLRPEGDLHFEANIVPEFGIKRATRSVLVIIRDISQRKKSEEALRKAQAERAAELAKANVALLECLDALASVSELDEFLGQVMVATTRQLGASSSALRLRDFERSVLTLDLVFQDQRVTTPSELNFPQELRILPLDEARLEMLTQPASVMRLLDNLAMIPDSHRSYLIGLGVKTLLILPLVISGQLIGSLTFRFTEDRDFRPEEIEVARALASQAGLAIQLTRLAKAARQSAVLAERNELAGEIHDSLAQFFTGITMQLGAATEVIKTGSGPIMNYLERASDMAKFGLAEARRSAFSLQPSLIEESGLIDALEKMVERSNIPGRLRCNFHSTGTPDESLPASVQQELLRITQEAMSNALRHAKPTVVTVSLRCQPPDLTLEVTDNGTGIHNSHPVNREGFGFANMRSRAENIGAKLEILTSAGSGTSIVVHLPL